MTSYLPTPSPVIRCVTLVYTEDTKLKFRTFCCTWCATHCLILTPSYRKTASRDIRNWNFLSDRVVTTSDNRSACSIANSKMQNKFYYVTNYVGLRTCINIYWLPISWGCQDFCTIRLLWISLQQIWHNKPLLRCSLLMGKPFVVTYKVFSQTLRETVCFGVTKFRPIWL